MQPANFCGTVTMCQIKRTFSCCNRIMLTLSITYPQVTLCTNPCVQDRINCRIQAQVRDFFRYAADDLYQQAIAACKAARENGFPFHPYDAVLQYEVTYNRNCHFSLYRDQYTFTGGAHGSTIRTSDTWDLIYGCSIPLSCFFPPGQDYRAFLTEQIIRQADCQMQQNPGIFFENYRDLIVANFNPESYYLTPSGLAVYYQQYEIAPYSTGIVVFTIPYQTLGWHPSCCASS